MSNPLKRWSLPSGRVHNMRDIGGLACAGGVTKYQTLLRADALHGLTDADIAFLLSKGLTTVIDLRHQDEIDMFPNAFAGHGAVVLHTPNTVAHKSKDMHTYTGMGDHYLFMAEHRGGMFAKSVSIIANAPGLTIVHCSAGKDRTGTLIALIEMLLGVNDADIVAEYQVSHTYIKPLIEQLNKVYPGSAYTQRSDPECIEMFIEEIRRRGGAETYLANNGLSAKDIDALRAKLVAHE